MSERQEVAERLGRLASAERGCEEAELADLFDRAAQLLQAPALTSDVQKRLREIADYLGYFTRFDKAPRYAAFLRSLSDQDQEEPCERCGGSGEIVQPPSKFDVEHGESRRWHEPCPDCHGTGKKPPPDPQREGSGEVEAALREIADTCWLHPNDEAATTTQLENLLYRAHQLAIQALAAGGREA